MVPAVKGPDWTETELNEFFSLLGGTHSRRELERFKAFCVPKIRRGKAHYGGAFLVTDLRADVLEEVADLCGYAFLAFVRLQRAGIHEPVLLNQMLRLAAHANDLYSQIVSDWPAFAGQTSNLELAARTA